MKNQPEHISRIHDKVEEIRLSTQVELADTIEKFLSTKESIESTYKTIKSKIDKLEKSLLKDLRSGSQPDGYVREINNVLESIKDINSSL